MSLLGEGFIHRRKSLINNMQGGIAKDKINGLLILHLSHSMNTEGLRMTF